ncbi:MAG TPA: hypothetical protein DCX54_00745 [Flavobacteriales bacterium]|nr:hypothetical protein [Flavobacteriales bacterium]
MTKKIIFFALILSVSWLGSCYRDVEEELYPCETTGLKYSVDIAPIIKANCSPCHIGTLPTETFFGTYETLKAVMEDPNSSFLCRINHDADCPENFMPKDRSKLSDCAISKIEAWAIDYQP